MPQYQFVKSSLKCTCSVNYNIIMRVYCTLGANTKKNKKPILPRFPSITLTGRSNSSYTLTSRNITNRAAWCLVDYNDKKIKKSTVETQYVYYCSEIALFYGKILTIHNSSLYTTHYSLSLQPLLHC